MMVSLKTKPEYDRAQIIIGVNNAMLRTLMEGGAVDAHVEIEGKIIDVALLGGETDEEIMGIVQEAGELAGGNFAIIDKRTRKE